MRESDVLVPSTSKQFIQTIKNIGKKYNSLVLLILHYDSPLLEFLLFDIDHPDGFFSFHYSFGRFYADFFQ